jgi:hypothetical protein
MIAPEPQSTSINSNSKCTAPPDIIDEDEWAAFERDVATPPPGHAVVSAMSADATISAPALSAADIALQSMQGPRKESNEAEVEEEKEDATRKFEEEFEEMESLEERLCRLREKREALRLKREGIDGEHTTEPANAPADKPSIESSDEDTDDEHDSWDDWRLR